MNYYFSTSTAMSHLLCSESSVSHRSSISLDLQRKLFIDCLHGIETSSSKVVYNICHDVVQELSQAQVASSVGRKDMQQVSHNMMKDCGVHQFETELSPSGITIGRLLQQDITL